MTELKSKESLNAFFPPTLKTTHIPKFKPHHTFQVSNGYTFLEPRTVGTQAVDGSIEVEANTITTKARHHKSLIVAKCEQILMADDKIRMTETVNRLRVRSKDGTTTVVTKPHVASTDENFEAALSFLGSESSGVEKDAIDAIEVSSEEAIHHTVATTDNKSQLANNHKCGASHVNISEPSRGLDEYNDAREYSTINDYSEPPGRIDEYKDSREYSTHLTKWLDSKLADIEKIGENSDKDESFNEEKLFALLECRDDNEVYETQVDEIRDDGCIIDKNNTEEELDHLRTANIELMRLVHLLVENNGEYDQLLKLAVSK